MSPGEAPLADLERRMLAALTASDTAALEAFAADLLPGAQLDPAGCLRIYRRSYYLRLRLCLGEQFPATRHALGRALFDDFADLYLRACPSRSYTLFDLGHSFADWLEAARPDRDLPAEGREDWIDFMVDLARHERELYRLFDAPGHEEGTWPDATVDDVALVLQPCLALARYRYPVAWYYHEVRAGRSPALPPPAPSHVVMLRRDYRTASYPVSPLHHRFLCTLRDECSIAAALRDIAEATGRHLTDVARSWVTEVRRPWIEAGFFVARDGPIRTGPIAS